MGEHEEVIQGYFLKVKKEETTNGYSSTARKLLAIIWSVLEMIESS